MDSNKARQTISAIRSLLNNNVPEASITPNALADVVCGAVSMLDERYAFGGVATLASVVKTPNEPVFYILNIPTNGTDMSAIGGSDNANRGLYFASNRADGSPWTTSVIVEYASIASVPNVIYPISIRDGKVTLAKDSVDSAYIPRGAITNDKLRDGTITGEKLSGGMCMFKSKELDLFPKTIVKVGSVNVVEVSTSDLPLGGVVPVYIRFDGDVPRESNTKLMIYVVDGDNTLKERELIVSADVNTTADVLSAFVSRESSGSIGIYPVYPFALV